MVVVAVVAMVVVAVVGGCDLHQDCPMSVSILYPEDFGPLS